MKCKILLVVLLALMWGSAARLWAHGIGTPQLINEPAGPYVVSVWTDPEPLRIDEAHVTVAVMEPETEAPILDAQVTVELVWLDDSSSRLTAPATREQATLKVMYTAVFAPPQAGMWQGTVLVDGPDGAGKVGPFVIELLPPARNYWGLVGGLALGLLMVGWLVRPWLGQQSGGRNWRRGNFML